MTRRSITLVSRSADPVRPDAVPHDVPRVRPCLRCRTPFPSEGFGERICRQCKGTHAWQSAVPVRRSRSRGRIGPGAE